MLIFNHFKFRSLKLALSVLFVFLSELVLFKFLPQNLDFESFTVFLLVNTTLYLSHMDVFKFSIPVSALRLILFFALVYNFLILLNRIDKTTILSSNVASNLIASIFMYLLFRIVIILTDRKGIGEGDADLFGLLGFFFGFSASLSILVYSNIIGLIVAIFLIIFLKIKQKSSV
ncbi:hypothetical protein D6810_01450, partial [Candidatus Dojkabacteria bacterium]